MSSISISVDGATRSVEADQKPTQIFADNKEIVVCKVNGQLKDLWTDLKDGDVVEGANIPFLHIPFSSMSKVNL